MFSPRAWGWSADNFLRCVEQSRSPHMRGDGPGKETMNAAEFFGSPHMLGMVRKPESLILLSLRSPHMRGDGPMSRVSFSFMYPVPHVRGDGP